jgi:hypothetical protein
MAWLICVLVFAVGGLATWSLTRGQAPSVEDQGSRTKEGESKAIDPPASRPAGPSSAGEPAPLVPPDAGKPAADTSAGGGSALRKQIDYSACSAAEWLFRMNGVKGRFIPGFHPSVHAIMEGDDYLRQVGAALTLARAARYTGRKDYAARATQAVLALLDDTVAEPDSSDSGVALRHTLLPSSPANRLAAAGLLVAAVSELPSPQEDLLKKSEELCSYLRRQQQADGNLDCGTMEGGQPVVDPAAGATALYGLMRSQAHRPASWKTDVARKALAYYAPYWRAHKSLTFVPWQTAAWAEAFLLTKEKPFADLVGEMNDWLCEQQLDQLDPRHPEWLGGFVAGKSSGAAPDATSASYAESLAEACRVAREAADLPRHRRYTAALELSLQFLTTLQYTDANTQHFILPYRQHWLVGGFHGSHLDGDLRIDHTQHALCAMIQYLTSVAR